MKKDQLETLLFFLKFALVVVLPFNFRIETEAKEPKEVISTSDWLDLKDRMSKIETDNAQHKNEMSFLKTTIEGDRDAIKELDGRVAQLEALDKNKTASSDDVKEILSKNGRQKRPYRLFPKTLSK